MKLVRVTITGADDAVQTSDLALLSVEFPFLELGILLSQRREGLEPRYPSREWIMRLMLQLYSGDGIPMRLAGHLCGEWARGAVKGPFLWALERHEQFKRFGRMQVNGPLDICDLDTVAAIASATGKEFMVQAKSASWLGTPSRAPKSISYLIDAPGGRGLMLLYPESVPEGYRLGFAGGIRPENVASVLERLSALPGDAPYWIDVETGARDDQNRFSLEKARAILEAARRFIA